MVSTNNNLQLVRVNHSVKMTEAFELMLSDESLCDVSICCGGQTLKAHRVILAACSTYFKETLSSINVQTQYPIVFVNGIGISDLQAMLEFMYRGEVTIPQKQLPSLVKSAETLGVSGLAQLDPNAQKCLSESEEQNKSRTSSPSDSATNAKKGKKRKKVIHKTENEISSDNESPSKKSDEIEVESEELNCDETELTDKLPKSKLRSWSQQIALKSHPKDLGESQPISDTETPLQSSDEMQTNEESTEKTYEKKQISKENWRHSRARRPPLKYSEYTLPKGIQEVKQAIVSSDQQKDVVVADDMTSIEVRPPSPRLTRGRSRVHSSDEKSSPIKSEPIDAAIASTSQENQNSVIHLTPVTRSRKQTHSPNDHRVKEEESGSQECDKSQIKSVDSEDISSQNKNKAQVKPQISNMPSTSFIKWRPKDPELTAHKLVERLKSPQTELKYEYESIQADGPPVYRCTYCMHSFRSKQNIIDHIKSVHMGTEDRYVCPLCSKQFKWKTSLNTHFNQSHPHSRPSPLRHFDKARKSS